VEGLRFTYNAKIIWGTMLLDFFATLLSNARTMLPIVAEEILGVGVTGYGVLATAQAVGAVVAGALLAMRRDIVRQGPVLFASVVVYGAATALFGVSAHFAASYLLFALTGAADTVSTVIRGTIRQLVTPDRLRGRMTSVNMVFFMGGPQLGEARAGVVAAVLGAPLAIASGGLATVAVALVIARRFPALAAYRRDDAEDASA
jgi:MFS family permease